MTQKTRSQLKAENAGDFPNNVTRQISPADLRGQMDDIVDSMFLAEDLDTPGGPSSGEGVMGPPGPPGPGGGSGAYYTPDIATMRAIPELVAGTIIYVGPQMDQFVVVDEPDLELDGGTAFIPNEYLSADFVEEVLPWSLFEAPHGGDTGTPGNVLYAHPLEHQGIDLDSVQCVVTDAGEIITGWQLHGHCMSKDSREYVRPQAPHIATGPGLFYDWAGLLTALANTRTGGMLLRYKYATNGLRLKRVIAGTEFQVEWWPIESSAASLEDDTNAVCWALNSCARMGASVLHFPAYMIGYARAIEHPDGLKLKGKGIPLNYDDPGISGLKTMPGAANQAYQLSWSSAPDPAAFPPATPATRWIDYMHYRGSAYCATVSRAANARVTYLEDFEINGNWLENLQVWTDGADYALTTINNQLYWRDTPWHCGYNCGPHGGRPVLTTGTLVVLHNTKIHGFYSFCMNGDYYVNYRSTGRHVVGNTFSHLHYWCNGDFESIETFGYDFGDGLRIQDLQVQLLKQRPYRAPSAFHLNWANVPYYNPGSQYRNVFSAVTDAVPNYSHSKSPWPQTKCKCIIHYWDCDMSGLDDIPAGEGAEVWTAPAMSGDQSKIYAGKLRLPRNNYASSTCFGDSINPTYGPWSTYTIRNLQIEYKSRVPPSFFIGSILGNGFSNAVFENITVEGMAASDLPEATTGGTSVLGQFFFTNPTISGIWGDYQNINFNTVIAASLGGGWIDITPPDAGAPTFRVWFDYNSASTPPDGTGVTLIEVNVAVGASAATIATAFTAAIRANAAALALLTAGPHQQDSRIAVVGSYTLYGHPTTRLPTINAFNAPGVVLAPRYHRRDYEPNVTQFTSFRATQAVYAYLAVMNPPAPGKQVYFDFKDCVFGAVDMTHIVSTGNVADLTHANWATSRDQIHLNWDNCRIDFKAGSSGIWRNFDPMLYCSTFHNVRARGGDLGLLRSEQSGQFTWIADGVASSFDIPTQLFYLPKVYSVRPSNAASAAWWRGNDTYVSLVRNTGAALGGTGYYYQSLDTTPQNEDRRAPRLRINLGAVPTVGTTFVVRWEAAVSPAGAEGMFQGLVGRARIEEGYDGLSATGDA